MDGIVIIDKPKGCTSRDVVNMVGKKLHTKRVGHTGTLDPMATGVLVVCVNEGLKIASFLSSDSKIYEVEATCGLLTDTLDIEGKVLREDHNFILERSKVEEVLSSFLGEYLQEVPLYSAVKVNGRRLYDYARNNESVELPKRMVSILDIKLKEVMEAKFTFRVHVSKGTYIRSLVKDIGEKLGILCTMSKLRRVEQGMFSIDESILIDDVKEDSIISLKDALKGFTFIKVDSFIASKIKNGRILENRYKDDIIVFVNNDEEVLAIYGIYDKDNTKIKPYHVFSNHSG